MKNKCFLRKYKTIVSAFAGAILCLGLNANAADEVVVDLFTEISSTADVVDGEAGESISTTPVTTTIMGGSRDINVNAISGGNDLGGDGVCEVGDRCSVMSIAFGSLRFNNDTGVIGQSMVQWDGDDQSIVLNPAGLGGLDLTEGGTASSIIVTTLELDHEFVFAIEAYTDATHFSKVIIKSVDIVNPGDEPTVRIIPFSAFENETYCDNAGAIGDAQILQFTCGVDGTVDFKNLGAMQVLLNIPHPSTGIRTSDLDLRLSAIVGPKEDNPPLACRLTGGGVTFDITYAYDENNELLAITYPAWDGTMADQFDYVNRYQIGGQVGAPTALAPQPKGEWTHHQQKGPAGDFVFHTGTASAPPGTEITEIRCSDPGTCFPSGNPPSPNKQLDFDCIGTFKNLKGAKWLIQGANVVTPPTNKKDKDFTFHYCEVNVDDNGEGPSSAEPDSDVCPSIGFGEKGVTEDGDGNPIGSNCDCDDFYRITIYNGTNSSEVVWFTDEDGNVRIDPTSLNKTDVIYEVEGYLGKGGNGLQLHGLTGFDTK